MHNGAVELDIDTARALIADADDHLAGESLALVADRGTDHVLFRVGEDLLARFPIIDWAANQPRRETHNLRAVEQITSVRVPRTIACGAPGHGYPWNWSLVTWLAGTRLAPDRAKSNEVSRELGATITGLLRQLAACTPSVTHRASRSMRVVERDAAVRRGIDGLRDDRASRALIERTWLKLFEHARATDDGRTTFIHGDLAPGNLLTSPGEPFAVIDWGGAGIGDPAIDLAVVWSTLTARERDSVRDELSCNDPLWIRSAAWALSIAIVALPYYRDRLPALATQSLATIDVVTAEFAAG